jgi:hypothetical protein
MGSDGLRWGWAADRVLFLVEGTDVRAVVLPDSVEDCAPAPEAWVVATEEGFYRVDPARAEVVSAMLQEPEEESLSLYPGSEVCALHRFPDHALWRADGARVPLPAGASRSRWLRPFTRGVGACWADGGALYRLDGRIEALADAAGVAGLWCGPFGAVVARVEEAAVLAGPRGPARCVDIAPSDVSFSADGARALLGGEGGAFEVDLATARSRRVGGPEWAAVGWLGARAVWRSLVDGTVRAGHDVVGEGFCGGVPSQAGCLLAGPGGAAWDLGRGARLGECCPGGVWATDGTRVAQVDDEVVRVGDRTFLHHLCADGDAVARARIDGETLVVTTLDGEVASFELATGELTGRRREGGRRARVAREIEVEGVPLGEFEVTLGGRRWVWGAGGMLVGVPA